MRSLLFALLMSLALFPSAFAAEVRLSVAASMTDALKGLVTAYQSRGEQVAILPNFASSGALAKQIAQGAPVDIFISANPKWMNYLVEEGRVAPDRVQVLAGNAVVFVARNARSVVTLTDLARLERIAIGSPKSVPAGQYAVQALKAAGLYDKVQGQLVMAKDVRQALIYAERGETDGAFVYRTDALLAHNAVILLQVPQDLYDEVTYPVALTDEGADNPEAVAFYEFLKSDGAAQILKQYGFVVR